MGMNFISFNSIEIVSVPFAPLAISLGEGRTAHASYAVCVPKGRNKIHPLLAAICTDRIVKEGIYAGVGLIQKRNQVILQRSFAFGIQTILPVHVFELVTSSIHRDYIDVILPNCQDHTLRFLKNRPYLS